MPVNEVPASVKSTPVQVHGTGSAVSTSRASAATPTLSVTGNDEDTIPLAFDSDVSFQVLETPKVPHKPALATKRALVPASRSSSVVSNPAAEARSHARPTCSPSPCTSRAAMVGASCGWHGASPSGSDGDLSAASEDLQVRREWPDVYVLPTFPNKLRSVLESAKSAVSLDTTTQHAVIRILFEDMMEYGK